MTTLLDGISSISLDQNVVSTLKNDLGGVAGRLPAIPANEIQQLSELSGKLSLPNLGNILGNSPDQLTALISKGLRSPDELWSSITHPLDAMETTLQSKVGAPIQTVFNQFRTISDSLPEKPEVLLGAFIEPLQQVAKKLGENPELQNIKDLVGKVEEIRIQLENDPSQLVAQFQEQVQGAVEEGISLVTPQVEHLSRFLNNVDLQANLQDLNNQYLDIRNRLAPPSGQTLAERIANLDFSDTDATLLLNAELGMARAQLENFAFQSEIQIKRAADLLPLFDLPAWSSRMSSAVMSTVSAPVHDFSDMLKPWRDSLDQAQQLLAKLSLDQILKPVEDLINQLRSLLDEAVLDNLRTAIEQGLQALEQLVNSIQQAQIDLLADLQSIANSISQAIGSIDLNVVTNAVDNAMASIDALIGQIEGLLDTVSVNLQDGLTSLQNELSIMHTKFTDPEGEYRKPIEDFLNTINDAIPSDIPAKLEEAGQTIQTCIADLGQLPLESVFDEVVQELDKMRQELSEIDADSLNAILREALSVALGLIKAYDFEGDIRDYLNKEYDEGIKDIAGPPIQKLQDQVDGILAYIAKIDPASLFDSLGISQSYQEMVDGLGAYRPSQSLEGVITTIRQAASEMDGFTPSNLLRPLTQPLEKLQEFIQNLSLEPILARLKAVLDRIGKVLAELDLNQLLEGLDQMTARVRQKLQSFLTVDGLLSPIKPIYSFISDAVNSLDPASLFQPIHTARQVILDSINSVDVVALQKVFDAIISQVGSFELPSLRQKYLEKTQAFTTQVTNLDLTTRLNEMRAIRQALLTALEARGIQTDDTAEIFRQQMLFSVKSMDPLPLLAGGLEQYRALQKGFGDFLAQLQTTLQDGGSLGDPLKALTSRLHELLLGLAEGVADIKQALRKVVEEAYAALGLEGVEQVYNTLKTTIESFDPQNLETALKKLIDPLKGFLDQLLDPKTLLAGVCDHFNALKAQIDPGLRNFLDALAGELQPILDAIIAKVQALNPQAVLQQLDTRYASLQGLKERVMNKLQTLLDGLDAPFQAALQLLNDLDPVNILVEPLAETYQAILKKVEGIDIRVLFKPLFDALDQLRQQMDDGIGRTFDAFEAFLAAAPV